MNIAAVMAALDVWDLDHMPKMALLTMACRAGRYSGRVTVPTRRLAADLHVHYNTAERAVQALEKAGYVTVDKRPGVVSTVTIDLGYLQLCGGGTSTLGGEGPSHSGARTKESLEKTKTAGRRHNRAPAVENPASSWVTERAPSPWKLDDNGNAVMHPRLTPDAIAACPYCDNHGRLWDSTTGDLVGQCTHQRTVSDLTLKDVLEST